MLMHNGKYAAEIAHNVSSRNRIVILERSVSKYFQESNQIDCPSQGQGFGCQSNKPYRSSEVRGMIWRLAVYRCFYHRVLSHECHTVSSSRVSSELALAPITFVLIDDYQVGLLQFRMDNISQNLKTRTATHADSWYTRDGGSLSPPPIRC